jgi:hypothetical protein
MQHGCVDRMLAITPGKQPVHGSRQSPIETQDAEQLRRQHDVAVAVSLALLDADDHPAAVDVPDLEARSFGSAQSGRIRRGQRGTRLQARYRFEKAHDFIGTQHHRQLLRLPCVPNTPTAMEVWNCVRDEGWPFGAGDQELVSNHRGLLS